MATSSALDANVNNNADSSEHFEPDSHVALPPEVPSLCVLCCFIGCNVCCVAFTNLYEMLYLLVIVQSGGN